MAGPAFIVATGDPEKGRGQRLSQARSHAAKRQHQKRPQRSKPRTSGTQLTDQKGLTLERALQQIPLELRVAVKPPPLYSAPIGYERMQDFISQYTRYSEEIHPFFKSVAYAAVTHPALMSSKILNASSWDDLNTGQEISEISLQQGLITRRLLSESMQDRAEACSDVTMAALVSVILFDLITEDEENLNRDEKGFERLLQLRGSLSSDGFQGQLKKSMSIVSRFKWVIKIGSYKDQRTYEEPIVSFSPQRSQDIEIFTLGPKIDSTYPMTTTLQNLYRTISIYREYTPEGPSPYLSLTPSDLSPTPTFFPGEDLLNDARATAIIHATWIFRQWTKNTYDTSNLMLALMKLKYLLKQTDLENFWGPLPGALIWCVVIGVRLSPPSPVRKWFIMQTTRTSCVMAMTCCEEVIRSLQFVLEGLDGGERYRENVIVPISRL